MDNTSHTHIRHIEALTLNAWPSLQTIIDDGWILRFADGYTSRANSVQPLYQGTDDLDAKIDRAESWYRSRGLDTTFKLTAAALPSGLDSRLEARGYTVSKPTCVQTVSLDGIEPPSTNQVRLTPALTDGWLEDFCSLREVNPQTLPTMRRMIGGIIAPTQSAALYRAGRPAALGYGVLEKGYIGLYDIVTGAAYRGQGLARELILHLLAWAKSQGAGASYLQVMYDNAPALHLYHKIGYREVYPYWYRFKP